MICSNICMYLYVFVMFCAEAVQVLLSKGFCSLKAFCCFGTTFRNEELEEVKERSEVKGEEVKLSEVEEVEDLKSMQVSMHISMQISVNLISIFLPCLPWVFILGSCKAALSEYYWWVSRSHCWKNQIFLWNVLYNLITVIVLQRSFYHKSKEQWE